MKRIDLIGKKFGKLEVIKYSHKNTKGNSHWVCKCECGTEKIVLGYNLNNGHTSSCGCLKNNREDLTGQLFGKLTVKSLATIKKRSFSLVMRM